MEATNNAEKLYLIAVTRDHIAFVCNECGRELTNIYWISDGRCVGSECAKKILGWRRTKKLRKDEVCVLAEKVLRPFSGCHCGQEKKCEKVYFKIKNCLFFLGFIHRKDFYRKRAELLRKEAGWAIFEDKIAIPMKWKINAEALAERAPAGKIVIAKNWRKR
jgi:hypothetical protein